MCSKSIVTCTELQQCHSLASLPSPLCVTVLCFKKKKYRKICLFLQTDHRDEILFSISCSYGEVVSKNTLFSAVHSKQGSLFVVSRDVKMSGQVRKPSL